MTSQASAPRGLLREVGERASHARVVLGIAGPPGSGKTTLAREVVSTLAAGDPPVIAAHVPQDGFHLSTAVLAARGLRSVKGQPHTFDAAGYARLLAALRERPDVDAVAPDYDRRLHDPVPGAIAVPAAARVIVAEGLYLAHDDGDWPLVRAQIDVLWRLDVPWEVARERLIERHIAGGRSPREAAEWADRVDAATTRLVRDGGPADAVLAWTPDGWVPS